MIHWEKIQPGLFAIWKRRIVVNKQPLEPKIQVLIVTCTWQIRASCTSQWRGVPAVSTRRRYKCFPLRRSSRSCHNLQLHSSLYFSFHLYFYLSPSLFPFPFFCLSPVTRRSTSRSTKFHSSSVSYFHLESSLYSSLFQNASSNLLLIKVCIVSRSTRY